MLYNYCNYKNISLPTTTAANFVDAGDISNWAKTAVQAMANVEILRGMGNNSFVPQGNATCTEVAQMFMNFMNTI